MKIKDSEQGHTRDVSASLLFSQTKLHTSVWMRVLFITLAIIFIILAIIGIILPGIPTVDFLVLAAFCASKGSYKLHHWLYSHRLFSPLLKGWKNIGGVSKSRKIFMSLSMLMASLFIYLSALHPHFKIALVIVLFIVFIWIWTRSK